MPGIFGVISRNKELGKEILGSMAGAWRPETHEDLSPFMYDDLGIYIGFSCPRGSFSGCQPIWNEKKNFILFLSGEAYIDSNEKDELKKRGHRLGEQGEFLIHFYEERGEKIFPMLNGRFAGLLLDFERQRVILFNDRYGLGRIYFHEGQDEFIFTSKAKGILAIGNDFRHFREGGLASYFGCGTVLDNQTLFSGISLLPAGSAWIFGRDGSREKNNYFNIMEWENSDEVSSEVFREKIGEIFPAILPRYFQGGEKIGISLTGGMDTRLIMACRTKVRRTEFPCYTFGGMASDSFDVKTAREVANICGFSHQIIRLNGNFLDNFPAEAQHTVEVTEGNLDLCGVHEIYLNRLARQIAPVRMTGNYGGEVLRNVSTFKPLNLDRRIFSEEFYPLVQESADLLDGMRRENPLSFRLFREIPLHLYGLLSAGESQVALRTPYLDNDLICLLYKAPRNILSDHNMTWSLIEAYDPILAKIVTDQGIGPDFNPLRRWVRYGSFKMEYYLNYGLPFPFHNLERRVPDGIKRFFVGRHKIENYKTWFQTNLYPFLHDLFSDDRSSLWNYLDKKFLRRAVEGHRKGIANYTSEISWCGSLILLEKVLLTNGPGGRFFPPERGGK